MLLIVAASLCTVAYYTLPKELGVKLSIVIDAAPEQIYPYLNNPAEWERWSAWNKANDPTMIHMYGGPWSGTGAIHRWSGDKAGNSFMVFKETVSPALLLYEQTMEGYPFPTLGTFELEKIAGGTQVTWQQQTPLADNPLALISGIWKKKKAEKELQAGLNGLKTLVDTSTKKRASK